MIGLTLLIFGGWALAYGIYDELTEDDDTDADVDLTGTTESDTQAGGDGNDSIIGRTGDDTLTGGPGNDRIEGGHGDDIAQGNAGNDTIFGAEGDDLLQGGRDDDTLNGDRGDDWVEGNGGDDTLQGGSDDDLLIGGNGGDAITGDGGEDVLFSGDLLNRSLTVDELTDMRSSIQAREEISFPEDVEFAVTDDYSPDTLDGGDGDDVLYFGNGDIATGGDGEDQFYAMNGDPDGEVSQITDFEVDTDVLLLVYAQTADEPELELVENDDGSQTLMADGQAVSLITADSLLSLDDVILFQRGSVEGGVI